MPEEKEQEFKAMEGEVEAKGSSATDAGGERATEAPAAAQADAMAVKSRDTEDAVAASAGDAEGKRTAAPTETTPVSPTPPVEPSLSAARIVAASSEEFRDSLQTIHGALELLVSGKVPDEHQANKFLGIAFRETDFLSHRVSDLHVASIIEIGKLRIKLTALDPARILDETIQACAALAADKAVALEFASTGSLPTVQADEGLLRMLFTNLIEAGIKKTPRDGALWIQTSAGANEVQLRFRCHEEAGINGSAEHPPDLESVAPKGLALYVAERIAAAHDGALRAFGSGQDTKAFELTLPLQPKGRKRGVVLVVDDNPQAAVLLEYALQEEGFEAIKAMNGIEGLKLAKSRKVDLVILDVLLPGLDGFEVCHRLRSSPETAAVPVIMISAKARDEDRATAMRIGADAYFGKPLGMAELMTAIEDLLEDGR